jgi:hypothetical protein
MTRTPSVLRLIAIGCLGISLGACRDMPSGPQTFQHVAAGQLWTAVTIPDGVPASSTWLPYIRAGDTPAARLDIQEIRRLRAEAARARREGELTIARARDDDAALKAASSLTRMPPPTLVATSVTALERWYAEAAAIPNLAQLPDLYATTLDVRAALDEIQLSLARGDTLGAVVGMTLASRAVRSHAPEVVALAAIEQVEALVGNGGSPMPDRAVHLLENAREALLAGNHPRAFWRALYALQLIETSVPPGVEIGSELR